MFKAGMNMRLIIDRFEGDTAVCETEDLSHIYIQRGLLPEGAREGDVIEQVNGQYKKDIKTTDERRSRISEKLKHLIEE